MPTDAERADENFKSIWRRLGSLAPTGDVAEEHGLLHVSTGWPEAPWNHTFVDSLSAADPDDIVDASRRFFGARRLPFTLRFPGANLGLAEACQRRGMVGAAPAPLMVASTDVVQAWSPGLAIEEIVDASGLGRAVEIECEAFATEAPRVLYTDVLFSDGRMTAYLGTLSGEAVATIQLVTSDYGIGIYDVTVSEGHRRRGIATAMVTHAMAEAKRRGFSDVSLDSSVMGRPLYAGLGFRCVLEYAQMRSEPSDGDRGRRYPTEDSGLLPFAPSE